MTLNPDGPGLQADVLLNVALVEEPATTGNRDARCRGLVAVVRVLKRMMEVGDLLLTPRTLKLKP